MHLASEYGYLEILNDDDKPVRGDEEGHFVWTGLINSAMPLIRYRIGDRGRWLTGARCACGRKSSVVVPTITRESDILRCADGRLFSPRALNQLLKETNSLRFCQFVQDRPNRVSVRAVGNDPAAAEEAMRVRSQLQNLLGSSIEVTAALAGEPLAGPGGKISLIVNQTKGTVPDRRVQDDGSARATEMEPPTATLREAAR